MNATPAPRPPRVAKTGTSAAVRAIRVEQRRSSFALAAVGLGFFMILLDGSALNIALPSVQRDVGGSITALQWVVNAYTIPLAGALLTAGNLNDRWGSRRMFSWSLALFTLASLACSMSPNVGLLVLSRIVQGIAAGGLLPTTLAIIARTYTDPIARAKAITIWGATGGMALMSGPLLGGALTQLFGWRWIFLINVPVGVLTLFLTVQFVRETPPRSAPSLDLPGQLTGVLALTFLVAGLIEGGTLGWMSPAVLALLVTGVAAGGLFAFIEMRTQHPMLPLAMFRQHAFSASIANGFAFQFGAYGMQFMLAVYLQDVWRLGAGRTGVLFLPFGISWVFGTIVLNRRLVGRGPRWLLWTGASVSVIGAVVLVLSVGGPQTAAFFMFGTALVGLGCGVFSPSLNASAMLSVEPQFSGLGSGVLNTARQIGMAVGVALLGVLVALSDPTFGMHVGMGLVAFCFLAIVVLSLRYVPRTEVRPISAQPSHVATHPAPVCRYPGR